MITMAFVIGSVVRHRDVVLDPLLLPECMSSSEHELCYYEAYVRSVILVPTAGDGMGFLPPKNEWQSIAPTWSDPEWRKKIVQGQVSDENAYAMGGISGHAGVFANVPEV